MRLIDADELLTKAQDYGKGQEKLMLIDPYYVKKAETIQAIPINVSVEKATNGDVFDCVFGGIAGYVTTTEKNGLMGQIALDKWIKERFPYLTTTNKWLETPYKQIKR